MCCNLFSRPSLGCQGIRSRSSLLPWRLWFVWAVVAALLFHPGAVGAPALQPQSPGQSPGTLRASGVGPHVARSDGKLSRLCFCLLFSFTTHEVKHG